MAVSRLRLGRARRRDPEAQMGVLDHLEELRFRIVVSVVAWLICAFVAWFFYENLIALIRLPLEQGTLGDRPPEELYVGGIATGFLLRIKVSAMAGVVFALPVILWQIFRFIAPGLAPKERKIIVPFIGSSILLFVFGAGMAYMLLPAAIRFLLGFSVGASLEPLLQFGDYVNFVSLMVLGFGVAFELPLLIVALGAVGVVSSETLRKKRGWALAATFIIGAVATPGGDPLSQTMMAIPLYLLFEGALLVLRFGFKK